jgi:ferrous iron transport protein A
MNLSEIDKNQKVKVIKITSNDELKQRFYSFGIFKGIEIEVENISLAGNTIEIVVDDTAIALRVEEAKTIEVEAV